MRINHNIQALNAYRNLATNQSRLSKTLEKLSSGLRVNRAADDAAGLAISEKMKSQIRGLNQAERNTLDGISLVQVADAGLESIHAQLQRARELTIQAGNETLADSDRQAIQREIEAIKEGINDIANNTDFNGIKPLLSQKIVTGGDPPENNAPQYGFVFFVDKSGSMTGTGGPLERLTDGIEGFIDELTLPSDPTKKTNSQVAFVDLANGDYKDFESDTQALKTNLDNLSVTGGMDPYNALYDFVPSGSKGTSLNYRSDAKKIFVLFTDTTDEVSYQPGYPLQSGYNDYSQEDARSAVEGLNIDISKFDDDDIQTFVFGFDSPGWNEDFDLADQNAYKQITDATGGKIYTELSTSEEVSEKLIQLIGDTFSNTPPEPSQTVMDGEIILQVGANENQNFKIELTDARTTALGIDQIGVDPYEKVDEALRKLDSAIQTISSERAKWGSYQNTLEHIVSNISNTSVNLSAANSRIADADMAKEMTEFTRNNILNQSAQAMLAQANQLPQGILQLLK